MAISKQVRERVYNKYDGHCAYCGVEIEYKKMQVDHIVAALHNWDNVSFERNPNVPKGTHDESNLNPSCARCNKWKSSMPLEMFRTEIQEQIKRLNLYSANYRLAKSYGLLSENAPSVVFYFERK